MVGLHELLALLIDLSISVLRLLSLILTLAVLIVLFDDMFMQSLCWLGLIALTASLSDDFDPLGAVGLLLFLFRVMRLLVDLLSVTWIIELVNANVNHLFVISLIIRSIELISRQKDTGFHLGVKRCLVSHIRRDLSCLDFFLTTIPRVLLRNAVILVCLLVL